MARSRGVGDSTPKKDDRARYLIRYVSYAGEYYRGPGGHYNHQPILRKTVRGEHARKIECDAIRSYGGRVVSVQRKGRWLPW